MLSSVFFQRAQRTHVSQSVFGATLGRMSAPQLIVVSHRPPYSQERQWHNVIQPTFELPGVLFVSSPATLPDVPDSVRLFPVSLSRAQVEHHDECCQKAIRPVLNALPVTTQFKEHSWKTYTQVNEAYAQETLRALLSMLSGNSEKTPVVWIDDYPLLIAALAIRKLGEENELQFNIVYSSHSPFPPAELIQKLPWADQLLQAILSSDLVTFHSQDHVNNFIDACENIIGARVDRKNGLVENGPRTVTIEALPSGIPYSKWNTSTKTVPVLTDVVLSFAEQDQFREIAHRIRAYHELLREHPDCRGKIVYVQITTPSGNEAEEQNAQRWEIDSLIDTVNEDYGTPSWLPIRRLDKSLSFEEAIDYYREADVAFMTQSNSGVNFAAKEFIAARDSTSGVLILSSCDASMPEALVANPYNTKGLAKVLYRAFTMPREEQEVRMAALQNRERENNLCSWLTALQLRTIATSTNKITSMKLEDFDYLAHFVGNAPILSLLLDYDGTLAPIAPKPELAFIPDETKAVLERLSKRSDVFVAIVSGRSVPDVQGMVGIDGITYAGNHGLEILQPNGTRYNHPLPNNQEEKVAILLKELEAKVCRDGAWVENKGVLLTYHYREVDADKREELITTARKIIEKYGFKAGSAHCAIECKPKIAWDKGRASIYILRTLYGVDWSKRTRIIFAGDDVTDEDAISALKGIAFSFRITSGPMTNTSADRRLSSTQSVLTMLKWVEQNMKCRTGKE